MWRGGLLWVVLLGSGAALAQAPPSEPAADAAVAPSEPPDAVLFEQRVAQQLAADGVVLSRHNLGLRIESVADHWTVSLIDLATDQPAASLALRQLPSEREVAVRVLARAAADLAQHLASEVTRLNARFNPLSLRFAATYRPDRQGQPLSSNQRWVVFRGAVDQELDPMEFYRIVRREDLAASYQRRQVVMFGSFVVATFGIVIGMELQLSAKPDFSACASLPPIQRAPCERDHEPSGLPALIGAGVGLGAAMLGTYLYRHLQPIDESEARSLAALYNHQLIRELGRPGVARRSPLRDLTLTPYATRDDAGLVLGARF